MDSLNSLKLFFLSQRRLSRGGIWAAAGKFSTLFLGIILNTLLVRLLTPEELGSYLLVFSIVNLSAVIGHLGLGRTSVKLVAESMGLGQPGRARYSISLILPLAVVGACLSAIIAGGCGPWIARILFNSKIIADSLALAALWAAAVTFKSVLVEIFRGFHSILYSEIFTDLGFRLLMVPALAGLWFAKSPVTFEQVVVLSLALALFVTLVGTILLGRQVNLLPREYLDDGDSPTLRTVLLDSSSIWLSMLLLSVQGHAVVWLLAAFTSPGEVALYYAAFQLASLIGFSLFVLQSVLPPVIAEMYARRQLPGLESVLQRGAFLAFLPSALIFLGLLLGGKSVLTVLYGEYYQHAYGFLVILCCGQLLNVWTGLSGETLFQTGHQKLVIIITTLGTGLAIVGSLLLVEYYEGMGIMLSITISTIFMNTLALLFVRGRMGIWTCAKFVMKRSHT